MPVPSLKQRLSSSLRSFVQGATDLRAVGVGAALFAVVSCTSETTTVPNAAQLGVYQQVDRVGRPGLKEIFEAFAHHETSNRNSPYSDQTLSADITSLTQRANVVSALVPDELQARVDQTSGIGYLTIESTNSTSSFGGRALTDDAMDIDLAAAYGASFGYPATNPCLASANEPGANTADGNTTATVIASKDSETASFPYLGPAR